MKNRKVKIKAVLTFFITLLYTKEKELTKQVTIQTMKIKLTNSWRRKTVPIALVKKKYSLFQGNTGFKNYLLEWKLFKEKRLMTILVFLQQFLFKIYVNSN